MAPGDIPPGKNYAQVINRAVKDCSCLVLMLSNDALNSVWVPKEVERAINYRKPVIPIQIEEVVLNDAFEFYISTDQIVAVKKIDRDSDEMRKVLRSIETCTGQEYREEDAPDTADKKEMNTPDMSMGQTDRPSSPQSFPEGTVLDGKYKILRRTGTGSDGGVYLAEYLKTGEKYTLRVIRKRLDDHEQYARRLSEEIRLLNSILHPALPYIIDVIQTEDSVITVMDRIDGIPFSRIIKEQGPQEEELVINWAVQLCDVLQYLHEHGLIHNGIRPKNILVRPEGRISLADFGMTSADVPFGDGDTASFGAAYYEAPEKFGKEYDKRADIYALGMTLYALVIGKDPSEPPYAIYPIRNVNPGISAGLEYIISKCMEKKPEDRYQDLREMRDDLINIKKLNRKLEKNKSGFFRLFKK